MRMRTKLPFGLLLLVFSVAVNAAIIGNSSCSATFGGTTNAQSGGWSCGVAVNNSINVQQSGGAGSINGSESISPTSISFSYQTAAVGDADVTVSASDSLVLYTSGPVRSGELVLTETDNPTFSVDDTLNTSIQIGTLTSQCIGSSSGFALCTGSLGSSAGPFTVPFTLGQPFDLDVSLSDESLTGGPFAHQGGGTITFSLELFESNGTTPVQILTPEPATLGFIALGLLSVVAISRKRSGRSEGVQRYSGSEWSYPQQPPTMRGEDSAS